MTPASDTSVMTMDGIYHTLIMVMRDGLPVLIDRLQPHAIFS